MGEPDVGPAVRGGQLEADLGALPLALVADEAHPVVEHRPDDTLARQEFGDPDSRVVDTRNPVRELVADLVRSPGDRLLPPAARIIDRRIRGVGRLVDVERRGVTLVGHCGLPDVAYLHDASGTIRRRGCMMQARSVRIGTCSEPCMNRRSVRSRARSSWWA